VSTLQRDNAPLFFDTFLGRLRPAPDAAERARRTRAEARFASWDGGPAANFDAGGRTVGEWIQG